MSEGKDALSLTQLVDLYILETDPSDRRVELLSLIFTHDELIPSIKNQSQILKKIFTYSNLAFLLTFLQKENETHASQLKDVKFDPSGHNVPMCLKLPFKAMEILSCECHIINDLLFEGSSECPTPLMPQLLLFLDQPAHYQLASYFSKVISAITKRVTSVSHKYNGLFARWLFGERGHEESALFKAANHLYSLSSIEYLLKWLLFSSKSVVKGEGQEVEEKTVVDFRRGTKRLFLLRLVSAVNSNSLQRQCLGNVSAFFQQMLTQTEKSNKIASSFNIKSMPTILNTNKLTTYDLVADDELISSILAAPEEGCLTAAKLALVRVFLGRYAAELAVMMKEKNEDGEQEYKIIQAIAPDQLQSLVEWIVSHLKHLLRVKGEENSGEGSPYRDKDVSDSRVVLAPPDKMLVLTLTELLRTVHSLVNFRPHLIDYYNANSIPLVSLVRRLMGLQNNLIQLETSKIVLNMLRGKRDKNRLEIPYGFARKLLTNAIVQLVEMDSARQHVIQWADLILALEPQHIFQDYEEEFEWEHIRETVEDVKRLHIGENRFVQANIDCFYSEEKALVKYSNFLNGFKVEVLYEEKKESKYVSMSERKAQIEKQGSTMREPVKQRREEGVKQEELQQFVDMAAFTKGDYLQFDVDDLMLQL